MIRGALKAKKIALCLSAILIGLALAEAFLLIAGYEPGFLDAGFNQGAAFDPYAPLQLMQIFSSDHEGVFKANPAFFPPRELPDGFRSPPMEYSETRDPKILFLGDSFVWGHSAEPINNCFVDLVRKHGYNCYNTGIPAAGPSQYAYLAEKYVPEVRPDIVAVMIFMGNDLNSCLRNPMIPRQNVFHITDRGWFYAYDLNGQYMTPSEAYLFSHNLAYQYFKDSGPIVRKLLLTSRVGTIVGVKLAQIQHLLSKLEGASRARVVDPDYVRNSLKRIRNVCDQYHAKMLVFLIPNHPEMNTPATSIKEHRQIFDGYDVWVPEFLTKEDYREAPNGHFNNEGHRKYADFILGVLRE